MSCNGEIFFKLHLSHFGVFGIESIPFYSAWCLLMVFSGR